MTSGRRSRLISFPAVVAALVLGGAALTAVPAQAADGPRIPGKQAAARPSTASQAELRDRIEGSTAELREQAAHRAPSTPAKPAPGKSTKPGAQIIGGVAATITEAPWMVQLHYFDDKGTADPADDEGYFCGGTLVAPAKVLTAAHCVDGLDWSTNGAVLGGTAELPGADGDLHGGQAISVWRQWVNPAFNPETLTGDVAVLTLGAALPYQTLQPASGTDTALYAPGTPGTVYGWGRTSSTSQDLSETLLKATVPVQADSTCGSAWGTDFVSGQMVCAGTPASGQDAGTVSPCNGDSGGPLVVGGRIAGIVSWGVEDCVGAGAYSVFSKTSTLFPEFNPRINDANLNFDDKADLFARRSDNMGVEYYANATGTAFTAPFELGDFGGVNLLRQVDWDRDFYQDYMYRVANGDLYWLHFDGVSQYVEQRVGTGWSSFKNILFPGDVTNDAIPDLVAIDSAGLLWTYPGNGTGGFLPRVGGTPGWGSLTVVGNGDYSGDGKPDLLARDSTGLLLMYKGRDVATSPFAAKVQVGSGWNFSAYVATGDVNGDGNSDIVVRDTAGALWMYPSSGSPTAPFSGKVKVGNNGWNSFNLFG